MSLKKKSNLKSTFAFRLTLWYASFFILSLIIIFFISYKILTIDLVHLVDRELLSTTQKIDKEFHVEGLDQVKLDIREGIEEEGNNRVFYRMLKPNLDIVVTSDPLKWPCLNFPILSQGAASSMGNGYNYHTLSPKDRSYKIRILSRSIDDGKYIVQIGKTMKDEEELERVYSKVFLGSVIVLLFCGITLSWFEAQRAMRGVNRITQTAISIGHGSIKQRVQLSGEGKEIDDLAIAFNTMLDRIEELTLGIKDVTNNIAHDLLNNLSRIINITDLEIDRDEGKDYQKRLARIHEESCRMAAMIDIMMQIAQADAGLKIGKMVSVDIGKLVEKGCALFLSLAQDKKIHLNFEGSQETLLVMGDNLQLQRVMSNLLDNAIKYTSEGGRILVKVSKESPWAVIHVQDTGIGIDQHQQGRIFKKFYRVKSGHSKSGYGLGLSYVASMISSLGGSIAVESVLEQGSTFSIRIPLQ